MKDRNQEKSRKAWTQFSENLVQIPNLIIWLQKSRIFLDSIFWLVWIKRKQTKKCNSRYPYIRKRKKEEEKKKELEKKKIQKIRDDLFKKATKGDNKFFEINEEEF